MKKILVSTLKAGMAFDKPVYIDPDNVLVDAFEPLKITDIERLTKWSIQEVETDGEPAKPKIKQEIIVPEGPEKDDITKVKGELKAAAVGLEQLEELVKDAIKIVDEAYETISSEKPYQISRIREVAEKIATLIHDNPIVYKHLYYLELPPLLSRHLVFSAIFGAKLGQSLGFSNPKTIELVFSILIMDVGMMFLPLSVRMKDGKLNEEEKANLHTHPLRGYQVLTKNVKVKNSIALVALQHQEHYDGSGYPQHIKGDDISEYARIAMIADSYVAILEDKKYRSRQLPNDALKELLALGIYYYDPNFIATILNEFSMFPVGSIVELSDGKIGMVVGTIPEKPLRPIIYIMREKNGERPDKSYFVHLLYRSEYYISRAVFPDDVSINYFQEIDIIMQST